MLPSVRMAYETWGELDAGATNAVLVCHALTGDSHATGPAGPGHPTTGWWSGFIGPGKAIDTERWFVVCVNVLGGCQGSTGPSSLDPDGRAFGSQFPVISVRDMVRAQAAVADALGIDTWMAAIGGSMGGMQVLEWGVMFPERVRGLIPIATCLAASAQQIGWWSTGRRIIRMDPHFGNGDYYDAPPGQGPHEGLALARMVSQITFRSDDVFTDRFGRQVVEPLDGFAMWQRFEVERYLEYHGDKLVRRFDANTYLALTKAMDLHDIGRGRGGAATAAARVQAPVLSVGVSSDVLYPTYQQREIAEKIAEGGADTEFLEIDSPHGHDGFLIEIDALGAPVHRFLEEVEKDL